MAVSMKRSVESQELTRQPSIINKYYYYYYERSETRTKNQESRNYTLSGLIESSRRTHLLIMLHLK